MQYQPQLHIIIHPRQAGGRQVLQGFSPEELKNLIGPFQTLPLSLTPKPGSNKLRMIQDMSYPRDNLSTPSVNLSIDSDNFSTSWGTFESTAELIQTLSKGCKAATFDISSAYQIIPIYLNQQHMLCVSWQELVYVNHAVIFGLTSSTGVFDAVADMLIALYAATGIKAIH